MAEDDSGLQDLFDMIFKTSNIQLGIETTIVTSTASLIIGILAYFVKRHFALKDYETQQNIEHSSWLLKKLGDYAAEHYVLLTRQLINTQKELTIADTTKNLQLVDIAYNHVVELIKTYTNFQTKTGANILFIDREKEDEAIGRIQSLFYALPFDDHDYKDISTGVNIRSQQIFSNWINTPNCPKSKERVKFQLRKLMGIFDKQTEMILHHKFFLDSQKQTLSKKFKIFFSKFKFWRIFQSKEKEPEFYIHQVNPKYVKAGDVVHVSGKGFKDEKIKYFLTIGTEILVSTPRDNFVVEIKIPDNISKGTYEITASFYIKLKNQCLERNEPFGIVIHID